MNVLLCPLSDPGYLYPAVCVGLALRRLGHDVHALVRPSAVGRVAAAGLRPVPADAYGGGRAFSAAFWFKAGPDQYWATVRAARETRADVLVTSVLCNGTLAAAEALDLPVVVIGLAAYLWTYPRGADAEPAQPAAREWRTRLMLAEYRKTRELVGLPGRCGRAFPLLGSALLLRGDPSLEFPGAVLPERAHHVGPCAWEPPADPEELAEAVAHLERVGKPVVYVHLGRVFGRTDPWPRLNAAFTGGRFQAVVEQGRAKQVQPDPAADILVVRKPWMGPLIRRAGLVLTSGTSAPVLGALLHGVPLGVSPAGSEQPLLGQACIRAGAAVRMPDEVVAGAAAALARAWEDQRMRERARDLSRRLAAVDSGALAADLVEGVVSGRLRPARPAGRPALASAGK